MEYKEFKNHFPTPECIECGTNGESGFNSHCIGNCETYKEWEVIVKENKESGLFKKQR